MSKKLSKKNAFLIFFIGLAGQIAWAVENQYYNVFMYNAITPEPLWVSVMVAASAIMATITAIIMGSFSDILGKRKPFLVYGFLFWTITTAIFPLAALLHPVIVAVMIAIFFDCVMTFFGSTAYDATFNAYVIDITTVENRGKALGILQLTLVISTMVTYGISGYIISAFGYYFFFYMVGFIVGIFGFVGALFVKEPQNLKPLNVKLWDHIKSTFKKDSFIQNKDCFLVLTGATIWGIGFNVFFPFILIYLQYYIGLTIETASLVVLIAFIFTISAAYPIGLLTDKLGRKKIAIYSVIFDSIAIILFAFSRDIIFLIITGALTQVFMTSWNISANTWIRDHYPEDKYGQFSGYFILFTVLFTMIPGPLLGGWLSTAFGIPAIIDGKPGYIPTPIIYVIASIIMVFAIMPLLKAKETTRKD